MPENKLSIPVLCSAILATACLYAQDIPSCKASSIILAENFIDISANSATAILRIDSIRDDIAGYTLKHEFYSGGDSTETRDFPPNVQAIEFIYPLTDSSHRFTIINNCLDGTAHTGASFSVDYSGADLNCPAITGLLIDILTDDFISFRWNFAAGALRYRVTYLAGSDEFPFMDTFEPFFEQALVEDSILHTFKIRAVCEGPESENSAEVLGPELKFSFITIDDIKLRQICVREIEEEILHAYRLICPDSSVTVSKEEFIAKLKAYEPPGCTTALEGPGGGAPFFKAFPNPATGHIFLQFEPAPAGDCEVLLYSQQGKRIGLASYRIGPDQGHSGFSLPLPELPAGLYWVVVRSSRRIFTQKLILQ